MYKYLIPFLSTEMNEHKQIKQQNGSHTDLISVIPVVFPNINESIDSDRAIKHIKSLKSFIFVNK